MPNLSQFYSQFTSDLARANHFEVVLNPPAILNSDITSLGLSYRCETAQLPGRHLTTAQQKTFGPYEKFPVHTSYNDIDLTFIMDGDMGLRYLFDAWLNVINPASNFNLEYKSNYMVDMTINQYDLQDNLQYQVTLIDAFPININQQDLSWSSDAIHKLNVTFAYTYWINDLQNPSSAVPNSGSQLNQYIATNTD
jgi:hypothetical protein